MKRMLIMILALSMVAVLAMPVFAEVQNIKVNGSIKIRGFVRDNYATVGSGGGAYFTGASFTEALGSRDWYNTQTRLGVSADLTDNVSANILIGNERDWQNAGSKTTVGLKNSYITLKEMLYSPLTLKIGKMGVKVADKLIVGDGSIGDKKLLGSDYQDGKSFDAIVGILDYDPLTLVLGTIKFAEASQATTDDVDGYLIDAIYKFEDEMDTVLDAYFATAHYNSPHSDATGDTTGPDGNSTTGVDVNVLAAVLTAVPVDGLSAKLGLAMQMGDYKKTATVSRDVDAMAFDLGLDYAIDNEYAPIVGLKYVYRSGADTSVTTGDYEGWLPMYEDQCNGIIYDPNTNISAIALTASMVPADRLIVGMEYWMYTLDEALKTATTANSTSDEAGQELDLTATYAYTEDVSMGLELAWFFPGNLYNSGYDETAQQIMLELGVKF